MDEEELSDMKKSFIFGALGLVALVLVFGSFFVVNAGQRGILLTFGNPSLQPYTEGIHFKLPLVQKVIKMDIQTQKYEADASAASSDLQIVETKIAVNYHLEGEGTPLIYRDIGLNYAQKVIQPAVQEVVKAATAKFTAEELITKRESVKEMIDMQLKDRLQNKGITMETTSITNFDFSKQFNEAIEAKVTAEQNALAAKNKLSQVEYEAKQRVTQSSAEAEAIKIQAQAIQSQGGKDYVQLQAIAKWNGILPTYMLGNNGVVPFLNIGESQNAKAQN